ncbi:YkgJ family cysteine cluster protein [Nanoarchaeota archaeon]
MTEFRCDPGNLCEGHYCCDGNSTKPALSIGDYIRLADHEGKKPSEVWREKGTVSLTRVSALPPGYLMVTKGLLHEPCPYLKDGCEVYEVRPMGCASFPSFMFLRGRDESLNGTYKDLGCLQNVEYTEEQLRVPRQLDAILCREVDMDGALFWGGIPPVINAATPAEIFGLAEQAADVAEKRDPHGQDVRTEMLLGAVRKARVLFDSGQMTGGLDHDVFTSTLSPIVFTLFGEPIAQRMDALGNSVLNKYRAHQTELEEVLKGM